MAFKKFKTATPVMIYLESDNVLEESWLKRRLEKALEGRLGGFKITLVTEPIWEEIPEVTIENGNYSFDGNDL